MHKPFDVIIAGAGLAGLTLARQLHLKNSDLSVCLVDPRAESAARHKVGESTVEIGAHYFAEVLGLRNHLKKDHLPKSGLRFFFGRNKSGLDSEADSHLHHRWELGGSSPPPMPSYQIERTRFENKIASDLESEGAEIFFSTKIKTIDNAGDSYTVQVERMSEKLTLKGKWLIDASGRSHALRSQMPQLENIKPGAIARNRSSCWIKFSGALKLDAVESDANWQKACDSNLRYLSTNHLMGPGYWVWLIPLAGDETSVGIVIDNDIQNISEINRFERAMDWLQKNEPQLHATLRERQKTDFHFLANYMKLPEDLPPIERFAKTGDSSMFADPFYSPGSDFIAMHNSFLSTLITQNRTDSFSIGLTRKILAELYRGFSQTYEHQYPISHHPVVMTVKILWDFLVYWTSVAPLAMSQTMYSMENIKWYGPLLEEVISVNKAMQKYLFTSYASTEIPSKPGLIDLFQFKTLLQYNADLLEDCSEQRLQGYLKNVRVIGDRIQSMMGDASQPKDLSSRFDQEWLNTMFK